MLLNPLLTKKPQYKSEVTGEEMINLQEQTFQIPDDFEYQVIEVTEDYIGRMDLISKSIYGVDIYSDLLCKLNGISNPFELNEGDMLVVPSVSSLADFNITPLESEDVEDESKPKAKKKNEKRAPNEAIIGDKRYRIDSKNRVIVY